jgi:hypothetical protein
MENNGGFRMRKLIIAATALAFIASPALAQTAAPDKGAAPAAGTDTGGDTMKKAPKKAKKSTAKKKTGDDATKQ